MSDPQKLSILSLGDGAVGKSSIIRRWVQQDYEQNYVPTIEELFSKTVKIDGKMYVIEITDTAGQEEFNQIKYRYMENSEGFLFVFSITDKKSFDEIEPLYKDVLKAKSDSDFYSIIVGNKYDLKDQVESIPDDVPTKLANKLGLKYFNTSALTMLNIEDAFNELIRGVIKVKNSGGCCSIM